MQCRHNTLVYKEGGTFCKECESFVEIPKANLSSMPHVGTSHKVEGLSDKLKHYGITNAVTGEGITKDTNVSEPVGMSATRQRSNRWV